MRSSDPIGAALDHTYPFADRFQRLHDLCLVRAPQRGHDFEAALDRGADQLGHCILRIYLSGAGQSPGKPILHIAPVEGHARSDHDDSVRGFLLAVYESPTDEELPLRIAVFGRSGILYF